MSQKTTTTTANTPNTMRYIAVLAVVVFAFFGAYRFAQARSASSAAPTLAGAPGSAGQQSGQGGSACACCGSSAPTADGVTGDKLEGTAKVAAGTQTIAIDVSKGYYQPNVIKLKAGVPAELQFGQASGCTAQVVSQDLGFSADLSAGPQTVKLDKLQPGTYSFACGMNMVFGKIVVE